MKYRIDVTKYFDYCATHPPFHEIIRECTENYFNSFANPSGISRYSKERNGLLRDVREYFARLTNKDPDGFTFTSGGSESNWMIASAIKKNYHGMVVYTSPYEHSSMQNALNYFGIQTVVLRGNRSGTIDKDDFYQKYKQSPGPLVFVYASNETGVVQSDPEIIQIVKSFEMPILSDMMQAFSKIPIDFSLIDGFSFSGHKIGAGMGAALLYCEPKIFKKEYGIFLGGVQEFGRRSGTENTTAISIFQKVSMVLQDQLITEKDRLCKIREKICLSLKSIGCQIAGEGSDTLPNVIYAITPLRDLDFLFIGMEEEGFVFSSGSSCKSKSRTPSNQLLAMGYSPEEAIRAIRISFGKFTKESDAEKFTDRLMEMIQKLL